MRMTTAEYAGLMRRREGKPSRAERRAASEAEEMMAFLIETWDVPPPLREHRFHAERMWRFDFAWPESKVAIEVEGVLWGGGGRHQRVAGFLGDCEKYLEAQSMGWQVVRVPSAWLARPLEFGDRLEDVKITAMWLMENGE